MEVDCELGLTLCQNVGMLECARFLGIKLLEFVQESH